MCHQIADHYKKARSERGVVVDDKDELAGTDDNLATDLDGENREESSRLDRDLDLDIDFPNPAINEIGSQLDADEATEWTFKEARREKEKSRGKSEEKTTTQSSIYQTLGVPLHFRLPPLPTIRSLSNVWTVLNNLNEVIYECEWKFNCFFLS